MTMVDRLRIATNAFVARCRLADGGRASSLAVV